MRPAAALLFLVIAAGFASAATSTRRGYVHAGKAVTITLEFIGESQDAKSPETLRIPVQIAEGAHYSATVELISIATYDEVRREWEARGLRLPHTKLLAAASVYRGEPRKAVASWPRRIETDSDFQFQTGDVVLIREISTY